MSGGTLRSGTYTLSTSFCALDAELTPNSRIDGQSSEACRNDDGSLLPKYRMLVDSAGVVAVDVQGPGTAPQFSITGKGTNSANVQRIRRVMEPGAYELVVRAEGTYALSFSTRCVVKPLTFGRPAAGSLAAASCQAGDVLGNGDASPAALYSVRNDKVCRANWSLDASASARLFNAELSPMESRT